MITYGSTFPFIEDPHDPAFWLVTAGGKIRGDGWTVTIPDGYGTDGASIPRPFWSICYPVDHRIRKAALLHDRLYETHCLDGGHKVARDFADLMLFDAMALLGGSLPLRWAVWSAVRLGGAWAWNTGPERRVGRMVKAEMLQETLHRR